MDRNYKEVVNEAEKELNEEEHKKWVDTVKSAAKDIFLKIEKTKKDIEKSTKKLTKLREQLNDLENGNVEYDKDGSVTGIVIEDRSTGDKIRINAKGEISDKVDISSSSSTGIYVDLDVK